MGSFKDRPTVNLLDCQHLIDTKHLWRRWVLNKLYYIMGVTYCNVMYFWKWKLYVSNECNKL